MIEPIYCTVNFLSCLPHLLKYSTDNVPLASALDASEDVRNQGNQQEMFVNILDVHAFGIRR